MACSGQPHSASVGEMTEVYFDGVLKPARRCRSLARRLFYHLRSCALLYATSSTLKRVFRMVTAAAPGFPSRRLRAGRAPSSRRSTP